MRKPYSVCELTKSQRAFVDLITPYENKWIALAKDETRIVASGTSLEKVLETTRKKKEEVVLMKVPSSRYYYVLQAA